MFALKTQIIAFFYKINWLILNSAFIDSTLFSSICTSLHSNQLRLSSINLTCFSGSPKTSIFSQNPFVLRANRQVFHGNRKRLLRRRKQLKDQRQLI